MMAVSPYQYWVGGSLGCEPVIGGATTALGRPRGW
jgi:hypothetical protein